MMLSGNDQYKSILINLVDKSNLEINRVQR